MARVSMNEMTTYRWSFEEDVLHYAAAGIRGIGVWRHKLSDYGEEKGIELLAEHRLEATSLMWGGGFTGSDGRSHRESIDDAKEGLRTAAHYGTPTLGPGVDFARGVGIEAILTFFLVTVIFGTAVDSRAPKLGGIAIGLTITMDILAGGPLTGAAMNPARAFGPALARAVLAGDVDVIFDRPSFTVN